LGACGTPGCEDPDCDIPFGMCHDGCGKRTELASQTRAARSWVKGYPKLYVATHKGRASDREKRSKQIIARLIQGESGRAIAGDLRVSHETVTFVRAQAEARGIELPPRKVGGAPRKHPDASPRVCKCGCGESFIPEAWDADREYLNAKHLGQANGARIVAAAGSTRREFHCAICDYRMVWRSPAQVMAAGGESKARFICSACDPIRRQALIGARSILAQGNPVAATLTERSTEAFRRVALIAAAFEDAIRLASPKRTGRRPPLATDLVIEAAWRELFPDRLICEAVNRLRRDGLLDVPGVRRERPLSREYVKQRRDLSLIWEDRPTREARRASRRAAVAARRTPTETAGVNA
jgi:transposase